MEISEKFSVKSAKIRGNKTLYAIALTLMLTFSALVAYLPAVNAHTPAWNIPTYAFIEATPNPVGLNQQIFLTFWIDKVAPTAAGIAGDRWTHYSVEVITPSGTKKTLY